MKIYRDRDKPTLYGRADDPPCPYCINVTSTSGPRQWLCGEDGLLNHCPGTRPACPSDGRGHTTHSR